MNYKHTWFYRLVATVLSLILALQMLPAGSVAYQDGETAPQAQNFHMPQRVVGICSAQWQIALDRMVSIC